jgi:hypothetical protein
MQTRGLHLVCSMLLLSTLADAQSKWSRFEFLSISEGLSQTTVHCIVQMIISETGVDMSKWSTFRIKRSDDLSIKQPILGSNVFL